MTRKGDFLDGKEKTAVPWRSKATVMFAGGEQVSQNWGQVCSCNHTVPFIATASIARANSLESSRLRPPSVRLIPGSGSATNTDSAKKKVPGETIKVTKNSKGASGCLSLPQDLVQQGCKGFRAPPPPPPKKKTRPSKSYPKTPKPIRLIVSTNIQLPSALKPEQPEF